MSKPMIYTKTDLCHRYGVLLPNGEPDTKKMTSLIGRHVQLPEAAWVNGKLFPRGVVEIPEAFIGIVDEQLRGKVNV